ncbi:MAG TPA: type III pantothenate kinase [Candidatus Dorea intestinavium]|nr:type III pantothenate kinase [Candidatus Dorea intestinavium]
MLLVIDVGNTHITHGVFEGETLKGTFRMTTKVNRTSDELGITIREMILMQGLSSREIKDVIIASVVPDVMHSLGSAIIKYFGIKPIIVSAGIKTGIRIGIDNPKQIGPDRIVDAVAGFSLHGGPLIVVDYGTATTYDLIGADGTFEAGVTAPGIRTAGQAMWGESAMLPSIEITKPASILAKETISSMQAGLVYGQIGQTEYIINKMKEESGYYDAKVVATGGLGSIIVGETDSIDVYDSKLTLKGLRIIFEKNRKNK